MITQPKPSEIPGTGQPGSTTLTITRFVEGLSSELGAMITGTGDASISLTNPHGDVITGIDIPATQAGSAPATALTGWTTFTETGTPWQIGTPNPTSVVGPLGYGWLGGAQRSTTPDTAGLTLMGVRNYNPFTGAFTGPDPIPGGNDTSYTYPNDPINNTDATGLSGSLSSSANRYEKSRCFWHPRQCAVVARTKSWAEGTAKRYAKHPDYVNGLRHLLWQAMLTWSLGAGDAKAWADAHERTVPAKFKWDSRRDQRNNGYGREIGNKLRKAYARVPWNEDNARRAAVRWAIYYIKIGRWARR